MVTRKRKSEYKSSVATAENGSGEVIIGRANNDNDSSCHRTNKKKNTLSGSHPAIRRTTRRRRVVVTNPSSKTEHDLEEDRSLEPSSRVVSRRRRMHHQEKEQNAQTARAQGDELKNITQTITHIPLWSSHDIIHDNDPSYSTHGSSNKNNKVTVSTDWKPLLQTLNPPATRNKNNISIKNCNPKGSNTDIKKKILQLSKYNVSNDSPTIFSSTSSPTSSSLPVPTTMRQNNIPSSSILPTQMNLPQEKDSSPYSNCLSLPLLQSFQKSHSPSMIYLSQQQPQQHQQQEPSQPFKCTCLAASSNEEYMALGDDDGNVYIYTMYPFMSLVTQYSISPFLESSSSFVDTTTSNRINNNLHHKNNILPAIFTKKGVLQHDTSIQSPTSTVHDTGSDATNVINENHYHYESTSYMTTIESLCFCNNPKEKNDLFFTLAVATTTHVELWTCHPNPHPSDKIPSNSSNINDRNSILLSVVKLNTCCIPATFPHNSYINTSVGDTQQQQYLCMFRGPIRQFSYQPGSDKNGKSHDKLLLSFTYGNWNKRNQQLLPFIHPVSNNNNSNTDNGEKYDNNDSVGGNTNNTYIDKALDESLKIMGPLLCWDLSNLSTSANLQKQQVQLKSPILESIQPPITLEQTKKDNDGTCHNKNEIIVRSIGHWSTCSPSSKNKDRPIIIVWGNHQIILYEANKIMSKVLIAVGIESIHLSQPLQQQHLTIVATRSGGGIQIYNTKDLSYLVTFGSGISLHGYSLSFQQAYLFQSSFSPAEKQNNSISSNNNNHDNYSNIGSKQPNVSLIAIPNAHKEPLEMTNTIFVWNDVNSSLSQPTSTPTKHPSSDFNNTDILNCNSKNSKNSSFLGSNNMVRKLPSFTFQGPLSKYNGIRHSFTSWKRSYNHKAIIVVTCTGHVQTLKSSISTDWAGYMYPPGYRVITNNVMYIEDEDELDNNFDANTEPYDNDISDHVDYSNPISSGGNWKYDDTLAKNEDNGNCIGNEKVLDYDDEFEDYDNNFDEELEEALKKSLLEEKKWDIIFNDDEQATAEMNNLFVPCVPKIFSKEGDGNDDYYNHDLVDFSSFQSVNNIDNSNSNFNTIYLLKLYPQWKDTQDKLQEETKAHTSFSLTNGDKKDEVTSTSTSITKTTTTSSSRNKSRRLKFDRRTKTNVDAILQSSINPNLRRQMMDREDHWADGGGSSCSFFSLVNKKNDEQESKNDLVSLKPQKADEKSTIINKHTAISTKLSNVCNNKHFEHESELDSCKYNSKVSKDKSNGAVSNAETYAQSLKALNKNNNIKQKIVKIGNNEKDEICLLSKADKERTNGVCAACKGRWVLHSCGKRTIPEDLEGLYEKEIKQKELQKQKALEEKNCKRKENRQKQQELLQHKSRCQFESKKALPHHEKLSQLNCTVISSNSHDTLNDKRVSTTISSDSTKPNSVVIDQTEKNLQLLKQLYNYQGRVETSKLLVSKSTTTMIRTAVKNPDITKEQILVRATSTEETADQSLAKKYYTICEKTYDVSARNANMETSNDSNSPSSNNSKTIMGITDQEKISRSSSKCIDQRFSSVHVESKVDLVNHHPNINEIAASMAVEYPLSTAPVSAPILHTKAAPKVAVHKKRMQKPFAESYFKEGISNEEEWNTIDSILQNNESNVHSNIASKTDTSSFRTISTIIDPVLEIHHPSNRQCSPSGNGVRQNYPQAMIQQSFHYRNSTSNYNHNNEIPNPLKCKSDMKSSSPYNKNNNNKGSEKKIHGLRDATISENYSNKSETTRKRQISKQPYTPVQGYNHGRLSRNKVNEQNQVHQQLSPNHSCRNDVVIGFYEKNQHLKDHFCSSNTNKIQPSSNINLCNDNIIHNPIHGDWNQGSFSSSQYSQSPRKQKEKLYTTSNNNQSSSSPNIFSVPTYQHQGPVPLSHIHDNNMMHIPFKTRNDHEILKHRLKRNVMNVTTSSTELAEYPSSKNKHLSSSFQKNYQVNTNSTGFHSNSTTSFNDHNNIMSKTMHSSHITSPMSQQPSCIKSPLNFHDFPRNDKIHVLQTSNHQQHYHKQNRQREISNVQHTIQKQQSVLNYPQQHNHLPQNTHLEHFNDQLQQAHSFQTTNNFTPNKQNSQNVAKSNSNSSTINLAAGMADNPDNLALLQSATASHLHFQTINTHQQQQSQNNSI